MLRGSAMEDENDKRGTVILLPPAQTPRQEAHIIVDGVAKQTERLSQEAALATPTTGRLVLPSVIAGAGPQASKRFVEFFTVPIRNKHTRQAYLHAACLFLSWCEQRGLALDTIEPIHVADYMEHHPRSPRP